MSRILLVSRSADHRRELAEAFAALGHTVEGCDGVEQAVTDPAEIVVVDNDPACAQGREAVRVLAAPGQPRRRIVWTGEGVASGVGLVFAEAPDAVLSPPITMSAAGAVLARLERRAGRAGQEVDLESVDGPVENHPPFRVLWAAFRARASGRLELYLDEVEREVFLRDGLLVGGRGFGDALASHGVQGEEEEDLGELMARAIAGGARPDVVLDDAARAIGRVVVSAVGRSGGMVFFDPKAELPESSVPLPMPIPRLLAQVLREARPIARVQQMLGPLRGDLLQPDRRGGDPSGLPPVALRLWRAADDKQKLGALVGQDEEAWLAADLLLQLGLARLAPAPAPQPVVQPVAAPTKEAAAEPGGKRRKPVERSQVSDELVSERKRLSSLDAMGVLGISRSEELEPRSIDERFRLLSSRFHPDRYAREPENVRGVARDCFAIVNDAYSALKEPAHRDEAKARLVAREQGRSYSSEADKRRARMLYAQGEVAFRRRQFAEAIEHLERAQQAHADDWKTTFLLTRARFEARTASAEECATALMKLQVPEGRARAELLYSLGEMLLAADREKAAFKAFQDAVDQYPEHIEAKRRLRLRQLRQDGAQVVRARDAEERARKAEERGTEGGGRGAAGDGDEPAGGSRGAGLLGGLFKRKDG